MTQQSVVDNKKVIKNSVFLYARMILMMVISLYTVRIILKELGVVDYGIYNVVGSVVALFNFITGALISVSNRFFSIEAVKNDKKSFNNCFCLNVTVFGLLFLVAVIFLETVGLWYVNSKMIIPEDRMLAANVVYQLSIIQLFFLFIMIPYNSLVVINERMSFFAYMGIFEAIARLGIAFLLVFGIFDKLILYAILMTIVSGIVALLFYLYCRKNYDVSRYRFYWNKNEFKSMASFVSWYFLGTISSVIKSQGLNLLINLFFNPAINAARAIAFQVEGALRKLTDGYFTAAKPQLYKAYSNGEYPALNKLILRTTLVCTFLLSVMAYPLLFNTHFVLSLWLEEVPDKAVIFLQLAIVDSIVVMVSEPVCLVIIATGKQALFQVLEFILRCLNIPISYILLKMGYSAEITLVVCIALSCCSVYMRSLMLRRSFPEFSFGNYLSIVLKILFYSLVIYGITWFIYQFRFSNIFNFFATSTISVLLLIMTYYYFLLDKDDRLAFATLVKNKLRSVRNKE